LELESLALVAQLFKELLAAGNVGPALGQATFIVNEIRQQVVPLILIIGFNLEAHQALFPCTLLISLDQPSPVSGSLLLHPLFFLIVHCPFISPVFIYITLYQG
jgi:hypothetical protein